MAENRIVEFGKADELDQKQKERTAAAPLPTDKTLKQRKNLPFQLLRFAIFNVRFMATFLGEKLEGDERI